ncbi:MAG: hypothetical protein KAX49_07135 [Halanaerobiales bacterium]|nr:hypothetical protein [Halanaerobiales bacterium]
MKLEVGMLFRIHGKIGVINNLKIEPEIRTKLYVYGKSLDKRTSFTLPDYSFDKFSHNLIDLIEVGDYVNGCEVMKSKDGDLIIGYVFPANRGIYSTVEIYRKNINNIDIEEILTKEQYDANKYVLEERKW